MFGRDPISRSVVSVVCVLLSQCPEFMKDRLRILTVEDEPAVTKMLALLLGGPAAKVTSASDGWMALMKIGAAAEPFDVIITDHRMRRVSGLELVRRLRVGEHPGLRGVECGHDARETLRCRRVATRDEPPHEKTLSEGHRAHGSASVNSGTVAIENVNT